MLQCDATRQEMQEERPRSNDQIIDCGGRGPVCAPAHTCTACTPCITCITCTTCGRLTFAEVPSGARCPRGFGWPNTQAADGRGSPFVNKTRRADGRGARQRGLQLSPHVKGMYSWTRGLPRLPPTHTKVTYKRVLTIGAKSILLLDKTVSHSDTGTPTRGG